MKTGPLSSRFFRSGLYELSCATRLFVREVAHELHSAPEIPIVPSAT